MMAKFNFSRDDEKIAALEYQRKQNDRPWLKFFHRFALVAHLYRYIIHFFF